MKPEIVGNTLRIRVKSPSFFSKFRSDELGVKGKLSRIAGYSKKTGWQTQAFRLALNDYDSLREVKADLDSIKGLSSSVRAEALALAKKKIYG